MIRILLSIPLFVSLGILWIYLNFLQVDPGNSLYSYIPYQAEQVFQFNSSRVIKKIVFERVFHEKQFLERVATEERPKVVSQNTGIGFNHPITIFKIFREAGPVWVFMMKVNNKDLLASYLKNTSKVYPTAYNDDAFFVALPFGPKFDETQNNLEAIANKNVESYPDMSTMKSNLSVDQKDIPFAISNHIKGNLLNIKHIEGGVEFLKDKIALETKFMMKDEFQVRKKEKVFVLPPRGIHVHGFIEPKDLINAVIQDMPFIDKLPDTRYFSLNIYGLDFEYGISVDRNFDLKPKMELLVKPKSLGEYEAFLETISKDSMISLDDEKNKIMIQGRFPIYYDQVGDMLYFSTVGIKKVDLKEQQVDEIASMSVNVNEILDKVEAEIPFARMIMSPIDALNAIDELNFTLTQHLEDEYQLDGEGAITFNRSSAHSIVELVAFMQSVSRLSILKEPMSAGQ